MRIPSDLSAAEVADRCPLVVGDLVTFRYDKEYAASGVPSDLADLPIRQGRVERETAVAGTGNPVLTIENPEGSDRQFSSFNRRGVILADVC